MVYRASASVCIPRGRSSPLCAAAVHPCCSPFSRGCSAMCLALSLQGNKPLPLGSSSHRLISKNELGRLHFPAGSQILDLSTTVYQTSHGPPFCYFMVSRSLCPYFSTHLFPLWHRLSVKSASCRARTAAKVPCHHLAMTSPTPGGSATLPISATSHGPGCLATLPLQN